MNEKAVLSDKQDLSSKTAMGPIIVATANAARAFDAPVRYPIIFAAPDAWKKTMAFPKMSSFVTLIEHFFGVIILMPILLVIKGYKVLKEQANKVKLTNINKAEVAKLKERDLISNWGIKEWIYAPFIFFSKGFNQLLNKVKTFERRDWISLIYISFGGSALGLFFYLISFALGNPTVAIIVQKMQPLITFIFAIFILRENPSWLFYIVLFTSLEGLVLLSSPDIIAWKETGNYYGLLAILFSLLAAIMWGGSTVFGRILTEKLNYWDLTLLRYIGGFIFLLFLNIPLFTYTKTYFGLLPANVHVFGHYIASTGDYKPFSWQIPMIVGIIYFAIFTGGMLPLALYYLGLKQSKAAIAGLAELAFPVLAIFVNWYFLGFTLTLAQIIGALVIFVSISVLTYVNAYELEHEK